MNWHPLVLSLEVTVIATVLLFVIGLSLGFLLARANFWGRTLLETLINLPMVLPPTVVGYYLLYFLGRGSMLKEWMGVDVLFTWKAIVIASAIMGMPLMVQGARAAIGGVDPALENAARTLGASEFSVFWHVTLPLARRGILAGLLLGATRALGEFGATLMVAGDIPGRTQTVPLAIYDAVMNRDYETANQLVLIMSSLAFLSLWSARWLERSPASRGGEGLKR